LSLTNENPRQGEHAPQDHGHAGDDARNPLHTGERTGHVKRRTYCAGRETEGRVCQESAA